MKHNIKKNLAATAAADVDESFEELEQLAAVAGADDEEDLDTEYEEDAEDEGDSEEGDDEGEGDEEEDEGDSEYSDEEDEDEVTDDEDGESDEDGDEEYVDEDESETDDEDGDEEAESDEDEFVEYEEDADGDEECDSDSEEDDEDVIIETEVDSDEDSEADVDEEAVLASLAAQGLIVVISTTDAIDDNDLGVAVAALEDDEYGDDSEDGEGDEDEVTDECDEEYTDEDESETDDEDGDEEVVDEDGEDDTEVDSDDESEDDDFEVDADGDDEEVIEEFETDDSEDESADEAEDAVTDDAVADDSMDEDRLAPVASREMLAAATVDDVEMVMHAGSNPVWNVIVAGFPAARIALSSYGTGAEEVRSFFVTRKFAESFKQAMAAEGVLGLLDKSNAEYYANAYTQSEVFATARAAAEKAANAKVTSAVSGLREDFVDALKIASAGMDKNFFQKPNHLKRELFVALSNAGVQNPVAVIEAAFAAASAEHFDVLAGIAEEFLDMPAQARDQLRNSIEGAGVIDRSKEADASVATVATASSESALALIRGMANRSSEATASVTAGTHNERKEAIRSLLKR